MKRVGRLGIQLCGGGRGGRVSGMWVWMLRGSGLEVEAWNGRGIKGGEKGGKEGTRTFAFQFVRLSS